MRAGRKIEILNYHLLIYIYSAIAFQGRKVRKPQDSLNLQALKSYLAAAIELFLV